MWSRPTNTTKGPDKRQLGERGKSEKKWGKSGKRCEKWQAAGNEEKIKTTKKKSSPAAHSDRVLYIFIYAKKSRV